MTRHIYKYPLDVTDIQHVPIHRGAEPIAVMVQNEIPCIWAIVDIDEPLTKIWIRIVGTGHPLPDGCDMYSHIGSFQLRGGALVFHAFEVES